jgi:hypothetical protein
MEKQRTFTSDTLATEWVSDLSECFEIKRVKISRIFVKYRGRIEKRWRLEADFE